MIKREVEKLGINGKSDLYICFYWPPRSGGTFVWQVLSKIFHKVATTHDSVYLETEHPIVIAYRDFRDMTISHWRTQYGQYDSDGNLINIPSREELDKMIRGTRGSITRLNAHRRNHWNNEKALWLKYEDFFNNHNYLFKTIEEFYNLELSQDKKHQIAIESSVENNKKRQKIITKEDTPPNAIIRNDFDIYSPVNKLHRHHIHTGEVGTWKKLLPEKFHSMMNERFSNDLKEWGYTEEVK